MQTILSQCVAGLQDVALRALKEDLRSIEPVRVEEGLIVFRTAEPVSRIRALPYLNNSYTVLHSASGRAAETLDAVLTDILGDRRLDRALRASVGEGVRTYRLFVSDQNELVSGPPALLARLRERIESATGLRFQSARADVQFWVMRRRSGWAYFLRRLTQRARTEKDLAPGELRPELAHLLCRLSEPAAGDVFLDPFAGSGAIPFARISYPYSLVYAFDDDEAAIAAMKERRKRLPAHEQQRAKKLIVRRADALALERIEDGFVDKVVTDPPWGIYRDLPDPAAFYAAALRELIRVTKPGGVIVLLTAQKDLVESLIPRSAGEVRREETHDLLVAGKKARVFKLRRAAA
jgi:16S rRNA G966 N2-methylase RsmD